MKTIYLSLGSNIGNRQENLERALERLTEEKIRVLRRSSLYETEPQDVKDQPWFLNMAAECETGFFPLQLLAAILKVEREGGRIRTGARRGPRIIDIDILLYGNTVINTPRLQIPHPRMLERRFVLEPLMEIDSSLRHPLSKEPLIKYLKSVAGQQLRKVSSSTG